MSLENLIPYYPQLDQNDSQLILYGMAEFQTLEANRNVERRADPGQYYKHQLIVSRLMMIKDRLFLIHKPGTGKSCALVAFDELIKLNTDIFKQFYMVTNPALMDTMKRQIICKCTNNKYINDQGGMKTKVNEVRRSGLQSFKNNYNLISYGDIVKELIGKTSAEIYNKFNYCIFNFDEITEVINVSFTNMTYKDKPDGTIVWEEKIAIAAIKALKNITNLDDPTIINSDIHYIQLWRLFHIISNSKIVIASATPSKNRLTEFFLLCNLLLPLNKQMDVEEFSNNVFKYSFKKYEYYLNGLFSYIEASNVVAKKRYNGQRMNYSYKIEYPLDETLENSPIGTKEIDSQYTIYKYELYGYQNRKIFQHKHDVISDKVSSNTSQYLCYVDSSLSYGESACKDIKIKAISDAYYNGQNIVLQRSLNRMNSCSGFTEVYRNECRRLEQSKLENRPGPGLAFFYLTLTKTVIAPLRELFASDKKFEVLYLSEHFNFLKRKDGKYCGGGQFSFQGLTKTPRVVFVDGDIPAMTRELIIELVGSPENIHGEYVQFIAGSEVMGIGVNAKNSVVFYRKLPEWNESNDKQSSDRVFREDGHDALREYLAIKHYEKTGQEIDKYKLDIYVDVFNMCGFCRFFYIENRFENLVIQEPIIQNDYYNLKALNCLNNAHLIGFSHDKDITKIHGKQLLDYCKINDVPYEKISHKLGIDININLENIMFEGMYMIISLSGVIITFLINDESFQFVKSLNILFHNNGEFMKNYKSGFYQNECKLIKMNFDKFDKSKIPTPAVEGEDYILYDISMEYLSPSEIQYSQMEKKSFGTRRELRIAKVFSEDKLLNDQRTYNPDMIDGSLECDYDTCKYKGISEILGNVKTQDSFLYEKGPGQFFTNYEVLYSTHIINECKANIIEEFRTKNKVSIQYIFKKLLPQYNREYFINMAIYQLISEKHKMIDSFGFNVYICATKDHLFLSRDFPTKLIHNVDNIGNYTKTLIAISNHPDYRDSTSNDDGIIREIESIEDEVSEDVLLNKILGLINKLSFVYHHKLIERCFGRIAYNRYFEAGIIKGDFDKNYTLHPCDNIVVGVIYSLRCYSMETQYGCNLYFHNQPKIKISNKQGEITRILNATDDIRYIDIASNKIKWVTTVGNEELQKYISNSINSEINKMLHKEFSYEGKTYFHDAKYYMTYYQGTYRLVSIDDGGTGRVIETTDIKQLTSCITYISNSYQSYYQFFTKESKDGLNNYVRISTLISLLNSGYNDKLKEQLISFFDYNNLIFYFSIPSLL